MDALFPILRDWQENDGAPTPMKAYVIYIDDLHGYEYVGAFNATAATYPGKFDIVGTAAVAPGTATVLTQLQQAESLNATLLCSFTYPPTSFAVVWDAVDADINFDAMIVGPGMNFEIMLLPRGPLSPGIGAENAHGMMGFAGWNEEIGGNVTADFAADYSAFFTDPLGPPGNGRFALDWWGTLSYYAGLECFVQGIERAGTLNNADLRAELAAAGHTTAKFDTVMGDVWFTNAAGAAPGTGGGLMAKACWPGHIGQWQFDVGLNWTIYEIIDIGTGTADGIYPKPDWP
jgi:ABC-type branched-subunit amino acid transport system substrate-binding protein